MVSGDAEGSVNLPNAETSTTFRRRRRRDHGIADGGRAWACRTAVPGIMGSISAASMSRRSGRSRRRCRTMPSSSSRRCSPIHSPRSSRTRRRH
jgi:hypothetical protein